VNKKILFLALLGVLVLPSVAFGQVTITGMVQNVVQVVWTVATAIVIILWVLTGILFLSAQGDPGKLKTAKMALFTSLAGTAVIILAYSAKSIVQNILMSGT
jgi:uncharacterized membrane protein (DUF485 family)